MDKPPTSEELLLADPFDTLCTVGRWLSTQRVSLQDAVVAAEDNKRKTTASILAVLSKEDGFPVKYAQYRRHRERLCQCFEGAAQ